MPPEPPLQDKVAATYSLRQRQPCRHIAAKEKYWQQEIYSSANLNPFVCPFTCFLAHSFGALLAYCFACLLHAKTKSKKKTALQLHNIRKSINFVHQWALCYRRLLTHCPRDDTNARFCFYTLFIYKPYIKERHTVFLRQHPDTAACGYSQKRDCRP